MGKEMTSWKDKLKAEREKYQAAELGAKVEQWKADLDAQHRAQQQANVDRAYEYQKAHDENLAAERAQARKDKLAEDAQKQANWEKEQKAKDEYNKGMLGIYGRRADIHQQNADTNASRATAASIRAAAAAGKKSVPVIWDSNGVGATVHLATDKLSPANLEQINQNLPEDVKSRYGITKYMRTSEYDDKILQAIGAELQAGNNAVYNMLNKLGVLTLPTATTIPNNQSVNPAITMPGVDANMTMPGV
jgi:chromosome segregation ATPase